jgi:hypothetical protein
MSEPSSSCVQQSNDALAVSSHAVERNRERADIGKIKAASV